MKKRVLTVRLLSLLLAMGGLAVTGCTDNDYDVNEIDTTIGIGGDGLELPTSSTSDIQLKDVLELEDNGVVVEDAETHNYVFRQTGNDVVAANPYIDAVKIAYRQANSHPVELSLSASARGSRAASVLKGEGDVFDFFYEADKPSEIVSLSAADVNSDIDILLSLSGIKSWVSRLDKITLSFPSYMQLKVVSAPNGAVINGNVLTLTNVSTADDLHLKVAITGVDFTKSDANDNLSIVSTSTGDKIQMRGKVHMAVEASQFTSGTGTARLQNTLTMSDITITSATGKFNPVIDLSNLGSVQITGVPDFLKDGNVVADIYNPVIKLDVQSNLGIGGKVSGKLIAVKNGQKIATVDVPEFTINSASTNEGNTQVYICSKPAELSIPATAQAVPVSNLSDIIKTIPDVIRFECNAHADTENEGTFLLGHRGYSIKPAYSIDAPLAFGPDAVIEYNDVLDGWNDDIEDYKLAKDAKIVLTTNVQNGVPAYLTMEASAIDASGNDIPASELEVKVEGEIAASTDGVTPVTSPLTITITQKDEDAFKKLDGLRYSVKGKAKGEDGTVVQGKVLNAEKHTLKLTDIKIKLDGKFIVSD